MKNINGGLCLIIVLLIMITGCSTQNSNPITPSEPIKSTGISNHYTWGLWQFSADPGAQTLEITPLRAGDFHLNALHFLEPPPLTYLTVESVKFTGNILDADIGLKHPFIGLAQFTGFDVCGIIITNGSVTGFSDPDLRMAGEGDTRLLNTDGYTRWWNPAEFPHGDNILSYKDGMLGTPDNTADYNCTLNAYKYFADGLEKDAPITTLDPAKRGVFSVSAKNIRHYKIDMGGGLIFNYAVDACWKMPKGGPPYTVPDDFPEGANRPEAWNVSVTELENTLYYSGPGGGAGGELKLLIDVYDHFNAALNKVHAESLSGLPFTSAPAPIGGGEGYSTYQLDFTGENLTKNGDVELLITVESEAIGYGVILPGKPISSYFVWPFNIHHHPAGYAWARTWGGNDYDYGYGVAIDGNGNAYITGTFHKTVDFDPGPGVDEHTSNGYFDIFLSKFDSNGEFQWARTWGGGYWDEGCGVAIDGSGNVYVTGYFKSTVDFDPGPGVDEHTSNVGWDIFLSKYNLNGEFQWARTWGGDDDDYGYGIAIDGTGNAYITGAFNTAADFDPGPGVDKHISNGSFEIFLSKFDSSGEFQWARTWGGNGFDDGSGVAIDGGGNACITGVFWGAVDFDPGPGVDEHTSNGFLDIFLSKFDSNGEFQWARTWGGGVSDDGYGVVIDGSGNSYITGRFEGTVDFDPGLGVDEHTSNESYDVFLSKFNSNGEFQWVRTWGGVSHEAGYGVTIDKNGNAYVTGYFGEDVDFDPGLGVDEHTSNGISDIFLSKFDSNGEFLWARTWGGEGVDAGNGVTFDGSSNVYITGIFMETVDFDPGPGAEWHTSNGDYDIFLSKFPPDGNW